mgnify:CR=1 FL=1
MQVVVVVVDDDFVCFQMYDIRVVDEMRNHLMMILSISNRKPGTQIRDMILNISESGPIQLLREPGTDRYDDIKIDCQLIDGQQTKETELNFIVSDCSKSHKIRGTFSYKHQVGDFRKRKRKWKHGRELRFYAPSFFFFIISGSGRCFKSG